MIDLGNWLDETHRIPADEPVTPPREAGFPDGTG